MVYPRSAVSILPGVALAALIAACAAKPQPAPPPPPDTTRLDVPEVVAAVPETVVVKDPDMEQRIARLEVTLLDREAQIEDLQARLDEARQEVVRAMAKMQTLATRAEAASGIAEAEIAVQSLRTSAGQHARAEIAQATQLLQQSSAEFNRQNYGGALYLATQAKQIASAGRGRVGGAARQGLLPGESLFAVPLRLQATSRCNVRSGPGTGNRVLFTLEAGAAVTAYSYVTDWIRVTDGEGRSGWVFRNLLGRR